MTPDKARKVANRVAFRATRITELRNGAEQALQAAVPDSAVYVAASACLGTVGELESRFAALVEVLRQGAAGTSINSKQLRSTAEESVR